MFLCRSLLTIPAILVSTMLLLLSPPGVCSGAAGPHPHQGVVPPFQAGDPKVKLDKHALHVLEHGHPYSTQIESETGGRGLVVQDVKAPTNIVWERILDYNNYNKMVPKTMESQNYKVEHHRHGAQTIFTRMKVGFPMVKLQFFVKHLYEPQQNSLTWTLDYSKKSDFDDSCGYWYVVSHPDNPEWSRVYYSVEVSMFDWVPSFVVNFMSKQALTEATGWVKKFSEMEYAKQKPVLKRTVEPTGWWEAFRRKPQREEDETCASTDDECSVDLADKQFEAQQVGMKRYALVTAVIALSFYNVHLFFSQ